MDKIKCKIFQVKNGFSRGWYVALSTKMDWRTQKEIMSDNFFANAVVQDWHEGFYKKHGCLNKYIIWLLNPNVYAEVTDELITKIKEKLGENDCVFE